MMKSLRWLSSEHALLASLKEAGAIPTLVPLLAKDKDKERPGLMVEAGMAKEVQLEALNTLYNICQFNKVCGGGGQVAG